MKSIPAGWVEISKDVYGPPPKTNDLRKTESLAQKWNEAPATVIPIKISTKKKRIRQDTKPLLNKLESEFHAHLLAKYQGKNVNIRCQAWRVKIANGSWFKVDFCAFVDGRWIAWEAKGNAGKNIDRGKLALKCAASQWSEVQWFLVWKENGRWLEQEILP